MEITVHIGVYDALKVDYSVICRRADRAEKEADKYRVDLAETKEQLALFRHELAELKRLVFGVRSERFEEYLDELTKGKESDKVRIVLV